jgi:hypothetical protein
MDERIKELTNKANNMLVVGLLSFVGIGLIGEFFNEVEWRDKGDDIFIVILAIISVIWYFSGQNRYRLSWLPFALLTASTIVKIGTVFAEFKDPTARGDELGLVVPMVILTIVTGINIYRAQRDQRAPISAPTHEMMPPGD